VRGFGEASSNHEGDPTATGLVEGHWQGRGEGRPSQLDTRRVGKGTRLVGVHPKRQYPSRNDRSRSIAVDVVATDGEFTCAMPAAAGVMTGHIGPRVGPRLVRDWSEIPCTEAFE
jgi:hypothetical protein